MAIVPIYLQQYIALETICAFAGLLAADRICFLRRRQDLIYRNRKPYYLLVGFLQMRLDFDYTFVCFDFSSVHIHGGS